MLISLDLRIPLSLFSLCFFNAQCVFSLYAILFLSAAVLWAFVPGSHTRNEAGSDVQPAASPPYMSLALGSSQSSSEPGLKPQNWQMWEYCLSRFEEGFKNMGASLLEKGRAQGQTRTSGEIRWGQTASSGLEGLTGDCCFSSFAFAGIMIYIFESRGD